MKVAVVGATGLVGSKMLQVLAERNFPVTELIPVASEKSIGKPVLFNGKEYREVYWMLHWIPISLPIKRFTGPMPKRRIPPAIVTGKQIGRAHV